MRFHLIIISVVISCLILGCNSNRLDAVPTDFIGEWETSIERYNNLIIEITDKLLLFKDPSGSNPPETYPILRIERDDKVDNLFTIFYETKDGLEYEFAFYFERSGEGVLRLKNQKRFKWKKIEKLE